MRRQINITCVHPGGGTVLVDQGRPGQRAQGIPASGPADQRVAARIWDILQLPSGAPLLEFTLSGGQWLISGEGQICLGGAEMNWKLNGRPAEAYTTIDIDGDFLLDGSFAKRGCRAYLGVRGQWDVTPLMDSVSPGIPGLPTIAEGWSVQINCAEEVPYTSDLEPCQHCPELPYAFTVIPGPEWSNFSANEQQQVLDQVYQVGQDSSRQGLRLLPQLDKTTPDTQAEKAVDPANNQLTMISAPVLPGTIQLSPAGPILLLYDAQTVGGFPRVLLLDKDDDINVAGQLKPGD
ncbi:MAG: hypothetical protein AAF828_09290, partial [Bacteroidota bacterium]